MSPPSIDRDRIALVVQQPWAELIVSGIKTIEVRSASSRTRGPIFIYASRRSSALSDALIAAKRHGLDATSLPKGALVGTAEIVGSGPAAPADAEQACLSPDRMIGRFAWRLSDARRIEIPLPVRFPPYGIWFYPFRRKGRSR